MKPELDFVSQLKPVKRPIAQIRWVKSDLAPSTASKWLSERHHGGQEHLLGRDLDFRLVILNKSSLDWFDCLFSTDYTLVCSAHFVLTILFLLWGVTLSPCLIFNLDDEGSVAWCYNEFYLSYPAHHVDYFLLFLKLIHHLNYRLWLQLTSILMPSAVLTDLLFH